MAADAYWVTNINWPAVVGGIIGLGGMATPVVLAWKNGRDKTTENSLKVAEQTAERLERANHQLIVDLTADRDYQKRRADEADEATATAETHKNKLEAEVMDVRRDGRAMADWAMYYRDVLFGTVYRKRELIRQFESLAMGTMTYEMALELAATNKLRWPELPPPVPMLREAAMSKPPNSGEPKPP